MKRVPCRAFVQILLAAQLLATGAWAASPPRIAQASPPADDWTGKDAAWVPTPPVLVEKMLDMAQVTPQDFVVDLGSGDGRNVIAAARRGARALGVEFNPSMVEWSKRAAARAGLADRARFVQGDMYEADISQATVLALFLLPENLRVLTPKFLQLKPGARIVANSFEIEEWQADETARVTGECGSWCTAHLYIVPARVSGTWRLTQGLLMLGQKFQQLTGTLWTAGAREAIRNARLRGDRVRFTVGDRQYEGRVSGNSMQGANGAWSGTRVSPRTW